MDNNKHPVLKRSQLTPGQKAADKLTHFAGSWTFIILFLSVLVVWMFLNVMAWIYHWDPYPFILLNLGLSCLAAIQAPIILMSQNRTTERDRIRSEYDYSVNRKAEREITKILKEVEAIKRKIK